MKRPELLAPAGDFEKLVMAVGYGADAVYLAGKTFGMRAAADNFDSDEMRKALAYCRERGVRAYVTCNTMPRSDDLDALPPFLEEISEFCADGVIVADPGVFRLAQKYAPETEIHISTQAGIVNYEAARFWYDLGAKRVVVARELSLKQIRSIRDHTPKELEIEAFVHGSMCVSFSGRCLMSNYLTGRDANAGACAQPCRWKYALVEQRRPDQLIPVYEDEMGTHIFNSKDMNMVEYLPELIQAGVNSLKIEGRMKSSYYAAVITGAYRNALDAVIAGNRPSQVWIEETHKVSHRPYYTGFYFDNQEPGQHYSDSNYIRQWDVIAYVASCDRSGNAVITQRNRFWDGDELELLMPGSEPVRFHLRGIMDMDGQAVQVCPHPEQLLKIKLPVYAPEHSVLRRQVENN